MNPSLSIKYIAYVLGDADPQHFSHAFHRYKGLSESHYRSRLSHEPSHPPDEAKRPRQHQVVARAEAPVRSMPRSH